ncbi:hypothetical protein D0X99_14410 [Algoriphagus lacus]|uniref:Uncharacterized protein n=1 Tax=Algoriphagus lacus TaxID=2056311 RepID=A0A418PPJ6_9BACT|nr:hypothetical protein [Algoriphagus lacus]RIW14000.1 hypothetical protein D0X99_14410 [Algoriphagus lacus]
MKTFKSVLILSYLLFLAACTEQDDPTAIGELTATDATAIDLAQTSGQLASGTSFAISGNSSQTGGINARISDNSEASHGPGGMGGLKGLGKGKGGHKGIMDGLNLLAPNDEILAIIDAESAGEIRGFRVYKFGGATITHYDAEGETVVLPAFGSADGPHAGHSGNQFPQLDSLLALIVKTEVDFGDGVTITRHEQEITRAGKIIIERNKVGNKLTELVTFEGYSVNDIQISGKKTTVSEFDKNTGKGSVLSSVANGKFVFADGEEAVWTSEKSRQSEVVRSEDSRRPVSGTIVTKVKTTIIATDGTVIYSHETTTPLEIDLSCEGKRRGPVLGAVKTVYRDNTITVNYGDGSCSNQTITITVNGETTTKTIGG